MTEPSLPDRDAEVAWARGLWDQVSAEHAAGLGEGRWAQDAFVWGLFEVPEDDLGVLGDVRGLDVLELGSGPAYVSAWLARRGARPVALDLSGEQLATAARCRARHGDAVALVQADAERLPLRAAAFDLVVSEHGVGAWCDPARWLPEAARVLRPGGRLVVLTTSLLAALTVPADGGPAGERLLRGTDEVARVRWPGGGVEFHPAPGAWIAALRAAGFEVEALHTLRPGPGAAFDEYYGIATPEWARRWPAEEMWVARRR